MKKSPSYLQRISAAIMSVVVLAALMAVPGTPWEEQTVPSAQAQTDRNWTTDGTQFGQCGLRQPGLAEAKPYAGQLCWIDLQGFENLTSTPKAFTRDLGRYTLTFNASLVNGSEGQAAIFRDGLAESVFGNYAFTPYANDSTKPILRHTMGGGAPRNQFKYRLTDITVRDKATGAVVPNYRIVYAEGEATTPQIYAESLWVDAPLMGKTVEPYTRLTPSNSSSDGLKFIPACTKNTEPNNIFGPGAREYYWSQGDRKEKDFACIENGGTTAPGRGGGYLAGSDSPGTLEISTFSERRYQGFALALSFAQMGGGVSSNTTDEKQITGESTKFDFSMATRYNGQDTTVPWQGAGVRTQVIRNMAPADPQPTDRNGSRAADQMVFKSTASGAAAQRALDRYKPTWTCQTASNQFTIVEGKVSSGFTLNNNSAGGYSELLMDNPYSEPVSCAVDWQPRFATTPLTIGKNMEGNAAEFSEQLNARFTLSYKCTAPAGYADAYPSVQLAGKNTVANGQSYTVEGLPQGATCTVKEEFPDGTSPTAPGTELTLSWNNGKSTGGALPETVVTLGAGGNSVTATNNFRYREGTLKINKHIAGEPVDLFGGNRNYRFQLRCEGTPYSQIVDLPATGTGDGLDGSVTFAGVPVGRECLLTPLSGLSSEESKQINFDGRTVDVDGTEVEARGDGSYPIKLPDYSDGETPTTATAQIEARYSFQTRDVAVIKQVTGPAAGLVTNESFPVEYRCTWRDDPTATNTGSLDIRTSDQETAKISGVRVGSECRVWEENTPSDAKVDLDKTVVRSGDANDEVTELSNEAAKTTPVLTVSSSNDDRQNRVVVVNHYVNKLGQVNLTKLVEDNGIRSGLPDTYELAFKCGSRSVEMPDGTIRDVQLTGSANLGAGQSSLLKASTGDDALDSLVNDQDGYLGVPFGNTCTFGERQPELSASGVLWSTDAATISHDIDADQEDIEVTNTFDAAGEGVTVSQNTVGIAELSQPVDYELQCTNDGLELPLSAEESRFTLSEESPTHIIPASSVPEGSTCVLRETSRDGLTRQNQDSEDYRIDRDSRVQSIDPDTGLETVDSFDDGAQIDDSSFTVGANSVVTVEHGYSFVNTEMTVTKTVAFDPATAHLISEARKDVKRNRQFDVQVLCTLPTGTAGQTFSGKVSSVGEPWVFGGVPLGSKCTATEGETTTAEGIDVDQEASAGGITKERAVAFTVNEERTPVEFTNTYTRRVADVQLNKIANAPFDIIGAAGGRDAFHTHEFVMECRDPETDDDADGELLDTFVSEIQGPGTTTFRGVPVGADCQITGDRFGKLYLAGTDETDAPLETHLQPHKVDWLVDRNDGSTFTDTDLEDGETTSQYFDVVDNSGQTPGTIINLTNYYGFVDSPLKMTKKITATKAGFDLLEQNQPTFDFQYQCKGVGYAYSSIGQGDDRLKDTLSLADFSDSQDNGDGTYTRTYESEVTNVPAGAWCTFREARVEGTPAELEHTAEPEVVQQRVEGNADNPVEFSFVNKYERRMVPVDVVAIHKGYLEGLGDKGYTYQLTCDDPAQTTRTVDFSTQETNAVDSVSASAVPNSGRKRIDLPAGSTCEISAANSAALQARPELEVTQGQRTPFMQFGRWIGARADENNPSSRLSGLSPDEVTAEMKNYAYEFSVAEDARSASGEAVMTVAGEAMHPRARVDVEFTKEANGAAGEDAVFSFRDTCNSQEFSLRAGESYTVQDLEIDRTCAISETDDGVDGVNSVIRLGDTGDRIANAVTVSTDNELPDGQGMSYVREWEFDILPVAQASDLRSAGQPWSLTGINDFPGVEVTKRIDGTPLSTVTGAVADLALLQHEADVMRFNYDIANTGVLPLDSFSIKEPGLAGKTVRADDGTQFTVDEDGTVPPELCAVDVLQAEEETTCAFDVVIDSPRDENYSYPKDPDGTVLVTAKAGDSQVSDSDSYGALRLKESVAWLLPETGRQTLVLFLLLGLLILATGLIRYLRNREDDDIEVDANRGVEETSRT